MTASAGAGGYAAAFAGVADLMTGASKDAAYEAAYGIYYQKAQGILNASNNKVAAEANIAAITQDKIRTDTVIGIQQDQAEAQAKVSAAVSGTEGQSLDQSIYQTEINSSVATANNRRKAEGQIEQQLSNIYASQIQLQNIDQVEFTQPDIITSVLQDLTPYVAARGQQFVEGVDSLFATETKGDIVLPS